MNEENKNDKILSDVILETRQGLVDHLVLMTGSIMGEIDRLCTGKGLMESPIERVGGYAYFIVYSSLSIGVRNLNTSFSYLDSYKKEICEAHTSSPDSILFVEECYEKSRKLYTSIIKPIFELKGEIPQSIKLSEEFLNIAYEQAIQNIDLRNELIETIAEITTKSFNQLVLFFKKYLPKIEIQ